MLAALASAMQVLAGAPEMLLLFWLVVGLVWLREIFGVKDLVKPTSSLPADLRPDLVEDLQESPLPVYRSFGRLAAVVVLAGGMTMVQMLPFFDLLAHSQRDRNFAGDGWPMPSWGWASLIIPLFHCYETPFGTWFQPDQYLVSSYYLGAGVLILAIVGAWRTKRQMGAIFGLTALFCWLLALGSNGFVFDWVKRVFPWIGIVRYPVKFALFPVLLLPLLAAWPIEDLPAISRRQQLRRFAILGSTLLLLIGALLWLARVHPLPQDDQRAMAANALGRILLVLALLGGLTWLKVTRPGVPALALQIGILALLPLDAFTHCPKLFPAFANANLAPGIWTEHLKRLPPKLGESRAMTSPDAARYLDDGHGSDLAVDFTGRRLAEWYNLNLLDGVPKADGALILRPRHFGLLWRSIYLDYFGFGNGLLDFLSVAWYSSSDNPLLWTARTNFLPVVSAGQRPIFVSDDQALRGIVANDFNPHEVVYLPESARSQVTVNNTTRCRVVSSHFEGQKIQAEIEGAEPSLVVLSQSFYHLWRATVDDKVVPLLRANLAFQALQVPAGKHHVVLVYRDRYFQFGGLISVLSLAVCGWLCFRPNRNAR